VKRQSQRAALSTETDARRHDSCLNAGVDFELRDIELPQWAWGGLAFVLWYSNVHNAVISGVWARTNGDALVYGLALWGIAIVLWMGWRRKAALTTAGSPSTAHPQEPSHHT
jgi:hypothetical protein